MSLDSNREILDFEEERPAEAHRPGLLKALCILTWIGSGAVIVYSCYALATTLDYYLAFKLHLVHLLFTIAASTATGVAALMMWRLQKKGFWIYAVAELLPVITAAAVITETSVLSGNYATGAFSGGIIVRIAFVAMYYRYYNIFR